MYYSTIVLKINLQLPISVPSNTMKYLQLSEGHEFHVS